MLSVAGNGSIGDFPDSDTPIARLLTFYRAHHAGIAGGGLLLHWAAFFFAFFAVAVWARVRDSGVHPLVGGAILVGAAVDFAQQLSSASVYSTLGFIGGKQVIAPAALQAWHVNGSGGGLSTGEGGLAVMLLALAAAGIAGGALPRWLSWTALPLGILQLTPIGFYAEMLFLLWAAVAGVYMTFRPIARSAYASTATPLAVSS
ncbi:MAG TPA: hypothetical protein VFL66_07850 [Gaiellaceae bacterium]|nr:hypothetical protein [Gaiellaceae bacterium]